MPGRAAPRPLDGLTTKTADELETAVRERCLALLAMQPRTRAELERSLARAGAPDEIVARVLDRLTVVKLVDDEAYAQAYVRTGLGVRRRGTRSLRAELRGRGVDDDAIESATAAVGEDDEHAVALALASRRAPALARCAPEVRRRRLAGLLLRRGFSGAVVSSVLAQVLAELPDADGTLDVDVDANGGSDRLPDADDAVDG